VRCTIVLEFQDYKGGRDPQRIELMRLHRNMLSPSPGDVGLTLAEGKMLLMAAQQQLTDAKPLKRVGRRNRLRPGSSSIADPQMSTPSARFQFAIH
jgi:hypothetical protein